MDHPDQEAPDPRPPEPKPDPTPRRAAAPARRGTGDPLLTADLQDLLRRPHRVPDVVLGGVDRMAGTLLDAAQPRTGLLLLLAATSVLFAIPYGAVVSGGGFWKVSLLFLGSLGICLPSLHVFSSFVGARTTGAQSLALGLLLSATAALFTFGFFPVLWFLQATMEPGSMISATHLSVLLLTVSLIFGAGQLLRCARLLGPAHESTLPLLLVWLVLLCFITRRMARVLDLL